MLQQPQIHWQKELLTACCQQLVLPKKSSASRNLQGLQCCDPLAKGCTTSSSFEAHSQLMDLQKHVHTSINRCTSIHDCVCAYICILSTGIYVYIQLYTHKCTDHEPYFIHLFASTQVHSIGACVIMKPSVENISMPNAHGGIDASHA